MIWYDMIWYDIRKFYHMISYDIIWHHMTSISYDIIIWYDIRKFAENKQISRQTHRHTDREFKTWGHSNPSGSAGWAGQKCLDIEVNFSIIIGHHVFCLINTVWCTLINPFSDTSRPHSIAGIQTDRSEWSHTTTTLTSILTLLDFLLPKYTGPPLNVILLYSQS